MKESGREGCLSSLMLPTWTLQCCVRRDTLGCCGPTKKWLSREGCHRSWFCSWFPLCCRTGRCPKASVSGTTNPWLKSIYLFQPPRAKLWQISSLICVANCKASLALIIHEAIIQITHRHWVSCRPSKKAFRFIAEAFKVTLDRLQAHHLFSDLFKQFWNMLE